jgi:hypothetical protein
MLPQRFVNFNAKRHTGVEIFFRAKEAVDCNEQCFSQRRKGHEVAQRVLREALCSLRLCERRRLPNRKLPCEIELKELTIVFML